MRLSPLLLAAALSVPLAARAQDQRDVAYGSLPPIAADYRAKISAWARGFFVDPSAVTGASISDPVLIRDTIGRLVWLVCLEATNTAPSARMPGPDRFAFGFAPNYVSAPLERRGATLAHADCDERPLVWRPFPGLTAAEARTVRRRARDRS